MFKQLYLSLRGRCSRQFYWLFGVLPFVVLGVVLGALHVGLVVAAPIALLCIWPYLAMQVKRWHDLSLSGWWAALGLVPFLNYVVIVGIGLVPGTKGQNRFGPDPLSRQGASIASP